MSASATQLISAIPEKHQTAIRAEFKRLGGRWSAAWGRDQWILLSEAIFAVENELEHKQGRLEPSKRKDVNVMRRVRNLVLDLAGENEILKRTNDPVFGA